MCLAYYNPPITLFLIRASAICTLYLISHKCQYIDIYMQKSQKFLNAGIDSKGAVMYSQSVEIYNVRSQYKTLNE